MKPLLAFVLGKLCMRLQLNNILIISPAKYHKIISNQIISQNYLKQNKFTSNKIIVQNNSKIIIIFTLVELCPLLQ